MAKVQRTPSDCEKNFMFDSSCARGDVLREAPSDSCRAGSANGHGRRRGGGVCAAATDRPNRPAEAISSSGREPSFMTVPRTHEAIMHAARSNGNRKPSREFEHGARQRLCALQQSDFGASHMATNASDPIVILSYARTPMGSFQGALAGASATELGATAVKAAVERAGHQRRAGRQGLHGLRPLRRPRPGPGAPGGDRRWPAQVGPKR